MLRHRSRDQLRNREGQLDEGRRQVDRRQGQFDTERELVRALVEGRGVIPSGVIPLQEQETELHGAAGRGDVAAFAGCVGCPEWNNAEDADGWTPLYHAARNGRAETVKALWLLGANKETTDDDGFTPLLVVAMEGHDSVVRLLASLGADVNAPRGTGDTPLWVAAQDGH